MSEKVDDCEGDEDAEADASSDDVPDMRLLGEESRTPDHEQNDSPPGSRGQAELTEKLFAEMGYDETFKNEMMAELGSGKMWQALAFSLVSS